MRPGEEDRFDPLIRMVVDRHFPELHRDINSLGWLWVKAQMWQESRMKATARSPVGAMGLMQIMPFTAKELGLDNPWDPTCNVTAGVRYLATQYRRMGEIPDLTDRLRFALASYNGGRGYINIALKLARISEGLPGGYRPWVRAGRPAGLWQNWDTARLFLSVDGCVVRHKRPDYGQIWEYVAYINSRFHQYISNGAAHYGNAVEANKKTVAGLPGQQTKAVTCSVF